MMTTTATRRNQSEAAAAEYRRLVAAGRYPEADQVRRTIETLVGRYRQGALVLPRRIRQMMGAA